jgi:hypothetical protein
VRAALVVLAAVAVAGGAGCGSSKSLKIDPSTENGLYTWEHGDYLWAHTFSRWERIASRGTRRDLLDAVARGSAGMRRNEAEMRQGIRQIRNAQLRQRLGALLHADQSMRQSMTRLVNDARAGNRVAAVRDVEALQQAVRRHRDARRRLAAFLHDHGVDVPASARAP